VQNVIFTHPGFELQIGEECKILFFSFVHICGLLEFGIVRPPELSLSMCLLASDWKLLSLATAIATSTILLFSHVGHVGVGQNVVLLTIRNH